MHIGLLFVYCLLIMASSLVGGFIPSVMRLGHRRMQMLLSVVGGLMLGVGVLHQLPHSLVAAQAGGKGIDWCVGWMVGGLLLTFFLIRWFHAHSHDEVDPADATSGGESSDCGQGGGCDHDHDHDHDHGSHGHHHHHHGHHHGHGHSGEEGMPRDAASATGWLGIFFGLSIHTLLDGVALGAHVAADAAHAEAHATGMWLLGVGTFLGVALHKPLDSLSITTLMASRGWSKQWQLLVNIGYSLMCPVGVVLFMVGARQFGENESLFVSAAVAMAAGVFICISLSDLLPEIEFHSHDRLLLSALLVLGLLMAWGVGLLEPDHAHDSGAATHVHSHDDGHNHGAAPDHGPSPFLKRRAAE
jgi:zinc and cadmium transporter